MPIRKINLNNLDYVFNINKKKKVNQVYLKVQLKGYVSLAL